MNSASLFGRGGVEAACRQSPRSRRVEIASRFGRRCVEDVVDDGDVVASALVVVEIVVDVFANGSKRRSVPLRGDRRPISQAGREDSLAERNLSQIRTRLRPAGERNISMMKSSRKN